MQPQEKIQNTKYKTNQKCEIAMFQTMLQAAFLSLGFFVIRVCFGFGISRFGSLRFSSWAVVLVLAVVAGCHTNDIPPGAIPQPYGTYDCQWIHAERVRADQDNFVIYQYEWSADVTKLTTSGQGHVAQIAQRLCQVPFPVVIEPSPDRGVDESRRMTILEALASHGATVTPDRVVLGRPEAEGLYGLEASGIAGRMLTNRAGGQGAGGGALGGGGAMGGTQGGISSGGLGGAGTSGGIGIGGGSY